MSDNYLFSKDLLDELTHLRKQLKKLHKEKKHLEISLEIITEHADTFEGELLSIQEQYVEQINRKDELLNNEKKARKQLLKQLGTLRDQLGSLGKKKSGLEISLETITEHADLMASQLLETQALLESKVAERTHELQEKNAQLENEVQERLRAEKSAIEAKNLAEAANRAKTVFLAKMSHELRTPLNAIIGYSDLLMEDVRERGCPELQEDLSAIYSAGEHLLAVISDVLDISKIESEQVELQQCRFSIAELMNQVESLITPSLNGNQFIMDCPPDIGLMNGDPTRVRQILNNLLNNAVKFTQAGEVRLSALRDRDAVEFKVADTGIGIAEDQLQSIFEAFNQVDNSYTRRYEGMGLGLTICQQLCHLMRGELRVSSQLGRGTEFTVRLPL